MQLLLFGTLGGLLTVQSVYDIRYKRLPLWITILGMAVGGAFRILQGNHWTLLLFGLIPGSLCLLFAKISKEAMGYGDGLIICMMGVSLSMQHLIGSCLIGFVLAGVVALILLVFGKRKGKQEIPLVPFLLVGYLLEVVLC